MPDEQKYYQMEITLGIEASSEKEADELVNHIKMSLLSPLCAAATERAKVFETFVSEAFDYPMD